jgi:archaellum component FlaF (FlaF/FlaG flagellin family)
MTSDVALSAIFQKIDLTNVTLCNNDYVTISVEPLTILFNGITTEYVEVYNALSQLLYEGTAERVPVPAAGVYIVKVDDEVVKVLVSD